MSTMLKLSTVRKRPLASENPMNTKTAATTVPYLATNVLDLSLATIEPSSVC